MTTLVDRIKARCRVDELTGCWIWTQGCNSANMPQINVYGLNRGPMPVRRLMWLIARGPMHVSNVIQTTCGDPMCVNPAHLRKISRKEQLQRNVVGVRRMPEAAVERQIATKRARGLIKLDPGKAESIRAKIAEGYRPEHVAQEFGISAGTVRKVASGERWPAPKPATWVTGLGR